MKVQVGTFVIWRLKGEKIYKEGFVSGKRGDGLIRIVPKYLGWGAMYVEEKDIEWKLNEQETEEK
jgi:hypothetical protein